jgi:hypothetical protein
LGENKSDLIRLLETELDFIEGGGYGSSPGQPPKHVSIFDRSPACINHWQVPGHSTDCHDDCILLDAVPAEHRQESMPCHFIPLNAAGDTIKSLEDRGRSQEALEEAVKAWLRRTIERLKSGDDSALNVSGVKY